MNQDQQQAYETLFLPMKKILTDAQWEWVIKQGKQYTQHITTMYLTPDLIREMREAQETWFRFHKGLNDAKGLEARVDALLKKIPPVPKPEQTNLF